MSFFETGDATFNPNLEKINPTDRVHADIPNERFNHLINNDVALKNQLDTHNHDGTYANINHKHSEYIEKEELGASLTGVAKETSEYNIENKIKEIENNVKHIKDSLGTGNSVIKSIQRGTFTMASTERYRTVSISPVNTAKTIVLLQGFRTEYNTQYFSYSFYLSDFRSNSFSITAETASSLVSVVGTCSWQVIEFY
nr:hypothetical protein [uncultured Tyzzerella sp.]